MYKDVERMLNAFKRNPLGKADMHPPAPPPNDMAPPQLQVPSAPVQGSAYGVYPQQYMQSMPGDASLAAAFDEGQLSCAISMDSYELSWVLS